MLKASILFLIIALIAGALGLPHVSIVSAEIAKILFGIFLFLFIATLVASLFIGKKAADVVNKI